eukprot:350618-Chlamydomonas_euryale.AAC.13
MVSSPCPLSLLLREPLRPFSGAPRGAPQGSPSRSPSAEPLREPLRVAPHGSPSAEPLRGAPQGTPQGRPSGEQRTKHDLMHTPSLLANSIFPRPSPSRAEPPSISLLCRIDRGPDACVVVRGSLQAEQPTRGPIYLFTHY